MNAPEVKISHLLIIFCIFALLNFIGKIKLKY